MDIPHAQLNFTAVVRTGSEPELKRDFHIKTPMERSSENLSPEGAGKKV
jgi:hypothetical protein